MSATLAIDIGQSGSRAVLLVGEQRFAIEGPGYWSRTLGAATLEMAQAARTAAGGALPQLRIAIGMSGFDRASQPAAEVRASLDGFADVGRIVVADDGLTAYLGALGQQAGAVIAAGTGSVGLAIDFGRTAVRVDGWGAELGDHGAGHWIGRTAIRTALRLHDAGKSHALIDAVIAQWGPLDRLAEKWRQDRPSIDAIAAFSAPVATLAKAGNAEALAIWTEAGHLLAQTAGHALTRAGLDRRPVPVATIGGVFGAGSIVTDPFIAELGRLVPLATHAAPIGSPLDGCLALADLPIDAALHALVDHSGD